MNEKIERIEKLVTELAAVTVRTAQLDIAMGHLRAAGFFLADHLDVAKKQSPPSPRPSPPGEGVASSANTAEVVLLGIDGD